MDLGPYWVGDKPRDSVDVYITRNGEAVDLSGYTSATIELENPTGLAVDTTGVGVSKGDDKVTITWPTSTSLFTIPGVYTMQVLLHTGSTTDHAAALPFEVRATADLPLSWATLSDVLTFTGVSVDGSTLAQAQGVVELMAGVSYADTVDPTLTALSARNLRKLKQAVAYQAAFMAQNEALFSRAAVAAISQDGLSVTVGSSGGQTDQTALILAPLAKVALGGLSWRRSGTSTLYVSKPRRRAYDDDAGCWQPLSVPGPFYGGV